MKTMTIFHFSGTGNTLYVTDCLSRCMTEKSWTVRNISITGLSSDEWDGYIADSDVLFLAYPIYGSDLPDNMRRFIETLPAVSSLPLGVLCTQLLFSGDGASVLFRTLRKKGYDQRWACQILMPNNLCIKGSPFSQSADYGEHEEKKLAGARRKVAGIASAVASGRRRVEDHTVFHTLLGLTQRPAFRFSVKSKYRNALSVDQEKCVRCGKCVRSCPAGVLEMRDDRAAFVRREECLTCFRCLNFCPASAVSFNGFVKEPLYKGPTKEIYKKLFN